ncbi:unnamed protein product [Protopolystoma xenopodis]|uniref:Uncharacterized protein n=1 Tax=Protopolystoma xenopodis TaxID=117903 RepID=A0A3S5FEV4_9PLAT|nr:unnamed protein product [Protopolystoma xenopodis]
MDCGYCFNWYTNWCKGNFVNIYANHRICWFKGSCSLMNYFTYCVVYTGGNNWNGVICFKFGY